MLVKKLYDDKLIDKFMFSFFLNIETKDSYIYFGSYEESILKDPYWVDLTKDAKHWSIEVKYVFLKG